MYYQFCRTLLRWRAPCCEGPRLGCRFSLSALIVQEGSMLTSDKAKQAADLCKPQHANISAKSLHSCSSSHGYGGEIDVADGFVSGWLEDDDATLDCTENGKRRRGTQHIMTYRHSPHILPTLKEGPDWRVMVFLLIPVSTPSAILRKFGCTVSESGVFGEPSIKMTGMLRQQHSILTVVKP